MTRAALEHVIRATCDVISCAEITIIGSQAILGPFSNAPKDLLVSNEADVFPHQKPSAWDDINGAIGELSPFHVTFGYYAHGLESETAVLPSGWRNRLVSVQNENTRGAIGLCLEAHDLAVSKLIAGREKDANYVRVLLQHGMVKPERVEELLAQVQHHGLEHAKARWRRLIAGLSSA